MCVCVCVCVYFCVCLSIYVTVCVCSTTQVNGYGAQCLFAAEYSTFATAQRRCEALGQALCPTFGGDTTFRTTCSNNQFAWAAKPCNLQIEVGAFFILVIWPMKALFCFVRAF